MKKVVRLTENDIEKLVKKIITEESKSMNEAGLSDWVRSKRFSDEEIGRYVLKGVEMGGASNFYPSNKEEQDLSHIKFELGGHKIEVYRVNYRAIAAEFILNIDGERIDVSDSIAKKILKASNQMLDKPRIEKKKDIKNSLKQITSQKFQEDYMLDEAKKKKKWIQGVQKKIEKKGTEGSFKEYCGGEVTMACIKKAMNSGDTALIRKANYAKNIKGYKGAKH